MNRVCKYCKNRYDMALDQCTECGQFHDDIKAIKAHQKKMQLGGKSHKFTNLQILEDGIRMRTRGQRF